MRLPPGIPDLEVRQDTVENKGFRSFFKRIRNSVSILKELGLIEKEYPRIRFF